MTCRALRPKGAQRRTVALVALAIGAFVPTMALAERPPVGDRAKRKVEPPPGPVLAIVSLSKQRIHIYGSSGLLAASPVSTGMAGFRTPQGVFTVLEKRRYHFSNIYAGAPMPYMQRLTWSGIALHGGVVPGYPASHGCVRLPHSFAPQAFGLTTLGTRVVVTPNDPIATPIAHPRLPVPRLLPLPAGVAEPPAGGKTAELASAPGGTLNDAGAPVKLFNPVERTKAMRSFFVKDAEDKTRLARLAAETAADKAAEARRATAALQAAQQALVQARRRYEVAVKTAGAADAKAAAEDASPAIALSAERARAALKVAEGDLVEAEQAAEEAKLIETIALEESAAAATVAFDRDHARSEAAAALKLAQKAEAPISILVSRKAGKIFVRQAWMPIYEAPVTFTDGAAPFGTHVYLAVAAEGETLRWLTVSLPPAAPRPPPRHRGKAKPPTTVSASALPQETASSVLSRFELSAATKQFIEERLWTGATLIVSDDGASPRETGLYTDFIILPR